MALTAGEILILIKARDDASRTMGRVASAGDKMGKIIRRGALAGGVAMVGLGLASIKTAIDFESAFAGVRKTVDATEAEFAVLKQGIRDMAKELPAGRNSIAAVSEAAGQLGIKTENILGFTRTMIDLGETTNLAATEAATALARLANITGLPQDEFVRLGSTIVALGNNLATTEAEIVSMGLRLAGAGEQAGFTEAQILSIAGAMSSMGLAAEAGGTAMSRVILEMNKAVATGSEELTTFASLAGQSVKDFARSFEVDAAGALLSFFEGLGGLSDSELFGVLEKLGFENVRIRDALLRTAGAGDLLRESIELGTQAWADNTALTEEAEQRYSTTASQFGILRNNLTDLMLSFGEAMLPAIKAINEELIPALQDLTVWVQEKLPVAIAAMERKWEEIQPDVEAFVALIRDDVIPILQDLEVVATFTMDAIVESFKRQFAEIILIVKGVSVIRRSFGDTMEGIANFAIDGVNKVIKAFNKLGDAVNSVSNFLTFGNSPFGDLQIGLLSPIGGLGGASAAAAIVDPWIAALNRARAIALDPWLATWRDVRNAIDDTAAALGGGAGGAGGSGGVGGALAAVSDAAVRTAEDVARQAKQMADAIGRFLRDAAGTIAEHFGLANDTVTDMLREMAREAGFAVQTVEEEFEAAFAAIVRAFNLTGQAAQELFDQLTAASVKTAKEMTDSLRGAAGVIADAFGIAIGDMTDLLHQLAIEAGFAAADVGAAFEEIARALGLSIGDMLALIRQLGDVAAEAADVVEDAATGGGGGGGGGRPSGQQASSIGAFPLAGAGSTFPLITNVVGQNGRMFTQPEFGLINLLMARGRNQAEAIAEALRFTDFGETPDFLKAMLERRGSIEGFLRQVAVGHIPLSTFSGHPDFPNVGQGIQTQNIYINTVVLQGDPRTALRSLGVSLIPTTV